MPTRDDLIADWRNRLAEAGDVPADSSSRPAWATRLRIRLYQFLISLYGDGNWHSADNPTTAETPPQATNESTEPTTWQGKPAKDISTIRATLSSVAHARSRPNIPGSFAEGKGSDAWTVVATYRGAIDPYRCASLLESSKILARPLNRRDDIVIEVRAKDAEHAARIIQANINWLRVFPRIVVPTQPLVGARLATVAYRLTKWLDKWTFELISLFHLALIIPLAYLWAALGTHNQAARDSDFMLTDEFFSEQFWLAFRGLLIIAILSIWLRAHWRARNPGSKTFV
jgi:hypothetical protein